MLWEKILRALGWSPQRPVGKARERRRGLRGYGHSNVRSSSSTKAVSQKPIVAAGRRAARTGVGVQLQLETSCRFGRADVTLPDPGAIGLEVIDFLKALVATAHC